MAACTRVMITTGLHEYVLFDVLNMNHLHFHLLRSRGLYNWFCGRQVSAVPVLPALIWASELEVKAYGWCIASLLRNLSTFCELKWLEELVLISLFCLWNRFIVERDRGHNETLAFIRLVHGWSISLVVVKGWRAALHTTIVAKVGGGAVVFDPEISRA